MTKEFFSLRPTHNSHRWFLPVTQDIAAGPPGHLFLFGGVGLGAAVTALERTLESPVIWATAQYTSFAQLDTTVDFDVHEVNAGKNLSQARVVAHIHDREILVVSAALGKREGPSDQWLIPEPAPSPENCPKINHWRNQTPLAARLEKRLIEGRFPDGNPITGRGKSGRLRLWIRSSENIPVSAAFLAVVADFAVDATSNAMGRYCGGNSLDNTIRFGPIVPSEWLLCDLEIEAIHSGITHSQMKIFSQDGILMASASQSLILRMHTADGENQPPNQNQS